jgi:hypothetical protein
LLATYRNAPHARRRSRMMASLWSRITTASRQQLKTMFMAQQLADGFREISFLMSDDDFDSIICFCVVVFEVNPAHGIILARRRRRIYHHYTLEPHHAFNELFVMT